MRLTLFKVVSMVSSSHRANVSFVGDFINKFKNLCWADNLKHLICYKEDPA